MLSSWENPLFLWSFSMSQSVSHYQRLVGSATKVLVSHCFVAVTSSGPWDRSLRWLGGGVGVFSAWYLWKKNKQMAGGLELFFMTFHSVGNVIIPFDELIFFRWVAQPPARSYIRNCRFLDLVQRSFMCSNPQKDRNVRIPLKHW